ncbi:MAG TPA: hypothetical protein PKI19_09995 [Elusimicrobiales bacterium]|nr:hypothetical protein [Elusimicrobiales bacterium]
MKKTPVENNKSPLAGPGGRDFRVFEGPRTRHRDYVLKAYKPLCDPRGRLHSVSAYRFAMQDAGCWAAVAPLVEALRGALGPDEVVWGVKYGPAGISSEFYFYSNLLNPPGNPKSAARIRKILKPFVNIRGVVPEAAPYFMCSLDFTAADLRAGCIPEFKIYLGSAANGHGGYSFLAAESGLRLENHYEFFPMPAGLAGVKARLRYSARAGRAAGPRAALLPAYLAACGTICYAVKPLCDAMYFSRINTGALERFLAENRPGPLQKMLAGNRDAFSHLLWDVGWDFAAPPGKGGGALKTGKIGVYGVF